MKIEIMKDEYWYGGCVKYGVKMPIGRETEAELDFTSNPTPNQAMPLLLSSKGRYLWSRQGFCVSVHEGEMTVSEGVLLEEGFANLKGAYLDAMKKHFPFKHGMPAKELFEGVIYNTWIELLFDQEQEAVLAYARGIKASGMRDFLEKAVLMIDDGWAESYGDWRFHSGKFPQPEAMLRALHEMDFSVMVWICPYVSADTVKFREARDKGLLIRRQDGEPYIVKWWNGYSAVLDLSNPEAVKWLDAQLGALRDLGVDGFKFDAGDSIYYYDDMVTYGNTSPDEQSLLWNRFGEKYSFNEYRAAAGAAGMALMQRLCDKEHSWGASGVASLIPDMLAQGITGYPFGCPDMVGGGEYLNFLDAADNLDGELFVRHCEIACLMPAIQFSAAPWRVLGKKEFDAVLGSLCVRKKYLSYLISQTEAAAETGEPVIRYMAYEFPQEHAETVTDQFMAGKKYLVAPVYKKGEQGREVFLPHGIWKYGEEEIVGDGSEKWFDSVPGVPVILERVENAE